MHEWLRSQGAWHPLDRSVVLCCTAIPLVTSKSKPSNYNIMSDYETAIVLDLPDIILIHVLQQLSATPTDIISFGLTCKAAYRITKYSSLWSSFCVKGLPKDVPAELDLWNAADFKHLWIGLVLPYGQLLGRLWHSNTWPSGQLIHVDAEPPRLVGRSLYYKQLNGGPHCHDVFVVELEQGAKATVTCWRDKHSASRFDSPAELVAITTNSTAAAAPAGAPVSPAPAAPAPSAAPPAPVSANSCHSPAAAVSVEDTTNHKHISCCSSSIIIDPTCSFQLRCKAHCDSVVTEFTSRKIQAQPYVEVRQQYFSTNPGWLQWQQRRADPGTTRSSNTDTVIRLAAALTALQANSSGSSSGSDLAGDTNTGTGRYSNSSSSQAVAVPPAGSLSVQRQQQQLLLPDVAQAATIDFIHFISLSDMLPTFATPVFTQLDLSPWIRLNHHSSGDDSSAGVTAGCPVSNALGCQQLTHAATAAIAAAGGTVIDNSSIDDATAATAALSLTGLWRGTYGSHGVEVLQLQLLLAPEGYDMFAAAGSDSSSNDDSQGLTGNAAFAADDVADSVSGVLLQGLVGHALQGSGAITAGGNSSSAGAALAQQAVAGLHDGAGAAAAAAAAAGLGLGGMNIDAVIGAGGVGEATAPAGGMQGRVVAHAAGGDAGGCAAAAAAAAAAAGEEEMQLDDAAEGSAAAGGTGRTGSSQLQQQQLTAQRQLLLVATKLTGDMNVPAGRVTFAVDVGSRCSVGAGQLLQLPPQFDTDVHINRPGTRELRIKERYRGRAQIAYTSFQAPHTIAAELLLLGPDCFALLWKRPVDSLSLFSRVSELPGLQH